MKFNLSAIRKRVIFPIIVIFAHPFDYPKGYVARVFNLNHPTDIALTAPTLALIRETVPPDMVCIPRSPRDDPHIVESYM